LDIAGRRITVQVWDTAGQEKFMTITKSYFRGADGILLCFDVSNRGSFDRVRVWMESIQENALEAVRIVLIGNKIDLERAVSKDEGNELAQEFGISYFETSAKTGEGIDEAFDLLARCVLSSKQPRPVPAPLTVEPVSSARPRKHCKC
jgi:small GTP-binding protein